MAFYRPSRRSSYAPSHHASGSHYPSFGLTYDPDGGFAAVDPFKPSVAYSIQNIWGPEASNTDDLHVIPPIRRRHATPHSSSATGYPPGPIHSQHRPGRQIPLAAQRVHNINANLGTTTTHMPYYSSLPGQPGPQPPIDRYWPWQPVQPVIIDSGSPARRRSPDLVQPAIISVPPIVQTPLAKPYEVRRSHRSRSRSSSDTRARDRRRRQSPSPPSSRSGSRRPSPMRKHPPMVILPRSRSRSSSPYTRRRRRSGPRSLSPLVRDFALSSVRLSFSYFLCRH